MQQTVNHAGKQKEDIIMEVLDLKKLIKFSPDRISREMLSDKPRCAWRSCAESRPEA
jgi:hypothetical protein